MAVDTSYSLGTAVRDLHQAGLLDAVLLPQQGALVSRHLSHLGADSPRGSFQGASLDSRNLQAGNLFVALAGETVDGRLFAPAAAAAGHWVLTREVSGQQPDPLLGCPVPEGSGVLVSRDPLGALAHLAACWRRRLDTTVIAVTGTNGKTTTKDLIRTLLRTAGKTQATRGNLNNHLGVPLTLLNLDADTVFAVIEMGASAQGEIQFLAGLARPTVGVITNASAAHLAEFGSLENIIAGKGELLASLPARGAAILNRNSPGYTTWQEIASCPVVSWGLDQGDHRWDWRPGDGQTPPQLILDGESWPVPLPGRHNAANLCAAILACRAVGVGDETMRQGLDQFEGSAHRGRLLTLEGRLVLDDSYNANPASMEAAVRAVVGLKSSGRPMAVLGTMAELGADSEAIHRETGQVLAGLGLHRLVAVGADAAALIDGFGSSAGISVPDHSAAVRWLRSHTQPGDRILVKGSRSAQMEKILDLWRQFAGDSGGE